MDYICNIFKFMKKKIRINYKIKTTYLLILLNPNEAYIKEMFGEILFYNLT